MNFGDVSGAQNAYDGSRGQYFTVAIRRPRLPSGISRIGPLQQFIVTYEPRHAIQSDIRAVRHICDVIVVGALFSAGKALGVQLRIDAIGVNGIAEACAPNFAKAFVVRIAAFRAWTVPGAERRRFIEEEELGIGARLHYRPVPAAKFNTACYPALDLPRTDDVPRIVVQNTAVSHKETAPRERNDVAIWSNAILQRHSLKGVHDMTPTYATGKICYIELPATDAARSAQFYRDVFGWNTHRRGDGATAFDDTVGQVSGAWVQGRSAADKAGLLVYIMVADASLATASIIAAGGEIVKPVDPDAHETFAHFRDPAGNVLGIYQQAGLLNAV
jgi:uncharacterized protein